MTTSAPIPPPSPAPAPPTPARSRMDALACPSHTDFAAFRGVTTRRTLLATLKAAARRSASRVS